MPYIDRSARRQCGRAVPRADVSRWRAQRCRSASCPPPTVC